MKGPFNRHLTELPITDSPEAPDKRKAKAGQVALVANAQLANSVQKRVSEYAFNTQLAAQSFVIDRQSRATFVGVLLRQAINSFRFAHTSLWPTLFASKTVSASSCQRQRCLGPERERSNKWPPPRMFAIHWWLPQNHDPSQPARIITSVSGKALPEPAYALPKAPKSDRIAAVIVTLPSHLFCV
jgi:hypothetical protein